MLPIGASVVISALYLASPAGEYWAGFFVVAVPALSMVAAAVGRPGAPRAALAVMALGMGFFMARNIVKRVAADPESLAPIMNGTAALGYLLLCGALISLAFRRRPDRTRAPLNRDAAIDGLLIMVGTAAAVITMITLPSLQLATVPAAQIAQFTAFPLVDTVVVLAIAYLTFVSAPGLPARRFLLGAALLLTAFDVLRGVQVQSALIEQARWVNVPLVVAYGLMGAFALHPSLPQVGRGATREVQSWTGARVAILALCMLAPAVLLVITPYHGEVVHYVIAAAAAATSALVLLRSVRAVRAHTRVQSALRVQAERDPLTGLGNRSALLNRIQAALAEASAEPGRTVSVLFIDLGGFKQINDTRGHATGDALLVAVAGRLRAALRASDFAARLGGDEFAVVTVDDAAGSVGERVAARVHALFETEFTAGTLSLRVPAAVGLANSAQSCAGQGSAEVLVSAADAAMYAAKRRGSGQWVRADGSDEATPSPVSPTAAVPVPAGDQGTPSQP